MDPNIEKVQQRFESWVGKDAPCVDGWQRWDKMWFLEQRPCSIQQFLALSDDQAVVYAYRTLLGRNPDPGGFDSYFQRLQTQQIQKEDLFFELRSSPEGVVWNAEICDVWPDYISMMWRCKKLWRWLPIVQRIRFRFKVKKKTLWDVRKPKMVN
ncbi:MAG: DUF4214 domain-containing protein [Oligoflexales bacterium]